MKPYSAEFEYLMHLVRCAIRDTAPSELPDGVLFDYVYKLGAAHDIANIAYYSVEKLQRKPDSELLGKWETKRSSAIVREINQSFAAEELVKALAAAGIFPKELQGTVLKLFYPAPEYRTMSDLDFIVKPKDLHTAREVLEKLGYECTLFCGKELNCFRAPNIYVELHTEYFPDNSDYYGIMGDPFEETQRSAEEILYLYSVLHTAKHYFYAGCGIRRLLDLYLLNEKCGNIRYSPNVRPVLESAGVWDFLEDFLEIADCFFGDAPRTPDERHLPMIRKIIDSGVHGTAKNKMAQTLEKSMNKGEKAVKLRYVMRRIFPEKWVILENYPILKRWGVLLPACYIHRLFYASVKNRKRLGAELRDLRNTKIK